MKLKIRPHSTGTPNMIPTIDILFQLVIFFVLACRFAVTEQFPVPIPDKCTAARPQPDDQRNILTVTLMKSSYGQSVECAVGATRLPLSEGKELAARIREAINERLNSANERIVCLRIARDVPFGQSQYALAGIAASSATDIQMAVLKN
jgi:biopolymer transport protein ExbD